MTKLLMIYAALESSVNMMQDFFGEFASRYGTSFRSMLSEDVTLEDLQWCDVLVSIRTQSNLEASLCSIAKKMGKFYALHIDDDFFSLPDYEVRRRIQAKALRKALQHADLIVSANDVLGERMCARAKINRRAKSDTAVLEKEIYKRTFLGDSIRAVYYASDGSIDSFESIIGPILPELKARYGERFHWTFLTTRPDLQGVFPVEAVEYVERMSLEQFRLFLRQGNFTLGIAPLIATEQTKCKYINKFMEYTTAGIPCIYSAVEPYAGFIRHGETGLLAETSEDWLEAFDKMSDVAFAKICVENAQQQLRNEFGYGKILQKFAEDFPELLEYKAPEGKNVSSLAIPIAKVYDKLLRIIDPFSRIIARWKLEGGGSVFKWIWERYICKKHIR